jgi:DNA invertase Pin-like site-specific DNA recombinase
VSDVSQEAENQRPACEALLVARGWDLVEVYVEDASAGKLGGRPNDERHTKMLGEAVLGFS